MQYSQGLQLLKLKLLMKLMKHEAHECYACWLRYAALDGLERAHMYNHAPCAAYHVEGVLASPMSLFVHVESSKQSVQPHSQSTSKQTAFASLQSFKTLSLACVAGPGELLPVASAAAA